MKMILSLVLTLMVSVCFAQSPVMSDPDVRERKLNGSFSAIEVSDGIILHLVPGKEEKLAVSYSEEKYGEKFKTEVVNGVLKIYFNREGGIKINNSSKKNLQAYVSYTKLEKLQASSGASVRFPETLLSENLMMKASSGATIEGPVALGNLSVDQNSGAMITLTGKSTSMDIDASSGSMFKGFDFSTTSCQAKASSGAGIKISITDALSAKANSGGSIHYKGTAVIKDIKVNSGGIVKKI